MYTLKAAGQQVIYQIINPFIKLLIALKITPNAITTVGLVLNLLAAGIFIYAAEASHRGDLSYIGWGGGMILFAGVFDMIDGRLARVGNMSSKFGAFYDSVLDRYSEMFMFLGICYYLISHHYLLSSLFTFLALIGSSMVSYTRSRGEGLGVNCEIGWMQRPERIVIIGGSALLCGIFAPIIGNDFRIEGFSPRIPWFETISIFTIPLALVAILSNYTAVQRIEHIRKALEAKENK
jgi:CDP-diacylglycerol---glycerol-3-phosphate 3-phosphatidyltransferase